MFDISSGHRPAFLPAPCVATLKIPLGTQATDLALDAGTDRKHGG
jgi:hypothetical protein